MLVLNKILIVVGISLASFSLVANENIHTEYIEYNVDGQKLVGYLSYDSSISGTRPGIIVVHEWVGLNDYAKKKARDLAEEGYVAFAIDMYGNGEEVPVSEARKMSGKVGSDFALIKKRFNAGLEVLNNSEFTDPKKTAAIGYCFGGGIVLNMARMGTEIDGVVGFHSSVNTGLTAQKGDIKTKILAFQGDADPAAPINKREAFITEMENNEAEYSYIIYDGVAAHNFTNPEGSTYYEKEANMAWKTMLEFFDSIF